MKRNDGRTPDQMRPIKAEVGVIPNADGSAMFQAGNTIAYAAVYGPREMYPRFMQNIRGSPALWSRSKRKDRDGNGCRYSRCHYLSRR